MKLYFHPFSQHSRRVRMLCHELNLELDLVLVAMERGEHRAPDFLSLNPAHAVPVLDDAGFVLAESHAIMRYLCQKHGADHLYPSELQRRACVDQWLDWTHCSLNPPIQVMAIQLLFAGDQRDMTLVERARVEARQALHVLETGLASKRGIGGELSLADIALVTTLGLYEMCGGNLDENARIRDYYGKLKSIPSFAATAPATTS